jgi:hypothetical protein
MPLSAIFQLYHDDQFSWWKKPEYPERITDHGLATGKLYHLQLRVECILFCNLQNRAPTQAVLVIGQVPNLLSHPGPEKKSFNIYQYIYINNVGQDVNVLSLINIIM